LNVFARVGVAFEELEAELRDICLRVLHGEIEVLLPLWFDCVCD
jgi:hypothetical protein